VHRHDLALVHSEIHFIAVINTLYDMEISLSPPLAVQPSLGLDLFQNFPPFMHDMEIPK
jgi:hypothetical protein